MIKVSEARLVHPIDGHLKITDAERRGDVIEWRGMQIPMTNVVYMIVAVPVTECEVCHEVCRTAQGLSSHRRSVHGLAVSADARVE